MVRNYKRKTARGSYTLETINAALVAVKKGSSIRKAAMDFNIPRRSLNNYWSKLSSINNPSHPVPAVNVIPQPAVSQPELSSSDVPQVEEALPDLSLLVGYAKARRVFTPEQERMLVQYLMKASDIYFGLAPTEVRRFAYSYACACNRKMPENWTVNGMAGPDWFSSFIKENSEISIRTPQATSMSQATNIDRLNVEVFF